MLLMCVCLCVCVCVFVSVKKMVDPFGDDEDDLSVIHYVTETWLKSNRMLAAHYPVLPVSSEFEESLRKGRIVPIGRAFDGDNGMNPVRDEQDKETASMRTLV
jgi:hypothetical protein